MRHFIDTEFIEDGRTIELISIGIVSEDGHEYYAVNSDIQTDEDLHLRISEDDWLCKNVIMHLPLIDDRAVAAQLEKAARSVNKPYFEPSTAEYHDNGTRLEWALNLDDFDVKPRRVIANDVRKYFLDRLDHGLHDAEQDDVGDVELWANYGAYDHVALMQLWGPMIKRPKHLPMFTHDLQQLAHDLGINEEAFPKQEAAQHDALADARQDQAIWTFLDAQRKRQEAGL